METYENFGSIIWYRWTNERGEDIKMEQKNTARNDAEQCEQMIELIMHAIRRLDEGKLHIVYNFILHIQ